MTRELYEQVKDEIPNHIGVYVGDWCIKKSKKQELGEDEQVLKNSLIRSLCRESEKLLRDRNPTENEFLERQLTQARREIERYKQKYWDLLNKGIEKFGARWYKEMD